MIRQGCLFLAGVLPVLAANAVEAQPNTRLQRYTLIVGANYGGADRPVLKYGVSDAERFARVMIDLGGVSPEHNTILRQPKLRDLIDGLDLLTRRVAEAARVAGPGAARTEVIVYYSGHADEKGLLLGEDRYSYVSLRDRLDQIPADVRIAVLDACASGAFTRIKGGKARPPFLVDQSASMRGHAFMTSSAANEVAQESDRIRASYFTHYLVSGLRGAADLSGDGRITLNEAYQFAFSETLGRTVDSRGGAQHPSYDINMSGTGDVVMTDVRQLSATLVLGAEMEGRFFVRNAAQELIVEVYKPHGRAISLGVEPGAYEVRVEIEKSALVAKVSVADGGELIVDRKQFNATTVEMTRSRGTADVLPYAVAGRNRLDLRLGVWRTSENSTVSPYVGIDDLGGGVQYTRYLEENLAITFAVEGLESQIADGVVSTVAIFPLAVRWNPLSFGREHDAIKPFVSAGVGPVIGEHIGGSAGNRYAYGTVRTSGTVGSFFRAGADFHFARSFAIGVDGGYNWLADFDQPVGGRSNYSGFSMSLGIGWLFGRGAVQTMTWRALSVSIAVTLAAAAGSGCHGWHDGSATAPSPFVTTGSGRLVTESRPVPAFDAIRVSVGGRAIVSPSEADSLHVTAEDNILPLIESTVANGTLTVTFRAGAGSLSSRGVTYHIGMRSMRAFDGAAGSSIEAYGIDTAGLEVRLSAGSTFTGSGTVDRLELDLSAGSRVEAPDLRSRVTTATLSAGCTALVRASDSLSVIASAGSQLAYLGSPSVQVQASGGSTVRRAGS